MMPTFEYRFTFWKYSKFFFNILENLVKNRLASSVIWLIQTKHLIEINKICDKNIDLKLKYVS